jgi:hypothetical protein
MDITKFEQQYGPDSVHAKHGGGNIWGDAQPIIARLTVDEPVDVVAFTEEMTKDEMIDHLVNVHNVREVAGKAISNTAGTKATKSEMVAFHQRVHEKQDAPDAEFNTSGRRYVGHEYVYVYSLGGYPVPEVLHRHSAPVLTPEQAGAIASVRNNKRADGVLSAQDRKVLTELVNNDFHSLKQEMKAFAADTLFVKKADINKEWDEKEKSIPDFASQATARTRTFEDERRALEQEYQRKQADLRAAYHDDLKAIVDQASEKGVSLTEETKSEVEADGRRVNRTVHKASVEGRKEALDIAERENKAFLDRALLDLERQRMTAQRQVLLSGVPEGAMTIVESIPDAKTLMVEAQKERSNAREITA